MLDNVFFDANGVICTYSGEATLRDICDAIAQYLTNPKCGEFKHIVHDFSEVESFRFAEDEFAGLASYAMENYQDADFAPRCAVTKNDTIKRSLDLYAELTGRKWQFFATLAEAVEWADSR